MGLVNACRTHNDDLRRLIEWEWEHSPRWIGCQSDTGAAHELTAPLIPIRIRDLCNRYRRISKQLGATVRWINPAAPSNQLLLTTATRKARADVRVLEESRANDVTPLALRLQRALKVLLAHNVREVRQLTLPDGRWKAFLDVPVPATDKRWSVAEYYAVCRAMDTEHPQAERAHLSAAAGQQ